MSDIVDKAYQATPDATLAEQIMNPCIAKNEREWWAHHEITTLRAEVERLRVALISARNFANSERRNTALLLSNPPQSSAAWNIRNHIDAALGERT